MNVPDELRKMAALYEERNALYGDNYKFFGEIMLAMLGRRTFATAEDYTRFAIFLLITAKLDRYAKNLQKGGHDDSLDDISVYSQMLKEVDNLVRGT